MPAFKCLCVSLCLRVSQDQYLGRHYHNLRWILEAELPLDFSVDRLASTFHSERELSSLHLRHTRRQPAHQPVPSLRPHEQRQLHSLLLHAYLTSSHRFFYQPAHTSQQSPHLGVRDVFFAQLPIVVQLLPWQQQFLPE
mmetsp:Transcript_43654/g.108656  ORF Transcript_43654/g.108656 Transcript_43654/m.108656 type:complete len:139 (-) Transcript_43654:878-1294(-)